MSGFDTEKLSNATLGEEVYRTTLASGLGISFCPKPGFQKRYACYSTHFGSIDNEFTGTGGELLRVPDGIAHFLEHTLFETPEGNASDLFARNGASNNASTSFSQTTYLFAASDRFWDNLGLLIDFVENPCFQDEKVEKERGIIEQEIKGYDDNPGWVSYRGLLGNLFSKHPVRIDIAGTVETIGQIDTATLQSCYDRFYHPSNMHLFVVGDLDREELFNFVAGRSRQAELPGGALQRSYPEEPAGVSTATSEVEMDVAAAKFILGFKEVGVPLSGEELVQRELLSELGLDLLFGSSSDLFRELYEKQLVHDELWSGYDALGGVAYAMVGADTACPEEFPGRLLDGVGQHLDTALSQENFERKKRHFIGDFVRRFNSLEFIAHGFTAYHFRDFNLFSLIDLINGLQRDMLRDHLESLLDPDRHSIFKVVPRSQ
ncbi:MAG: pitrilysin family protein [Planctomycetota bacterium]|nr:pitrilysin family protein [Planctomycetota bacterium]